MSNKLKVSKWGCWIGAIVVWAMMLDEVHTRLNGDVGRIVFAFIVGLLLYVAYWSIEFREV